MDFYLSREEEKKTYVLSGALKIECAVRSFENDLFVMDRVEETCASAIRFFRSQPVTPIAV